MHVQAVVHGIERPGRNDIPRNIAERGNVKNKINSTIAEPVIENPDKQIASTIKLPAEKQSIPDPNQNDVIINPSTTDNNTTNNQVRNIMAFVDRRTVESLPSRSAVEITTRSYVDPEFTFIRTSQMYINQNMEFYYIMKLAEQIQYAEVNSKDKNPARTIYDASLGRVTELFAANKSSAPSTEEKKNLSLWTFAELGVQTFNTITSSELELKLQKDDEGKVVSYGIESGLIDFEKEVKK